MVAGMQQIVEQLFVDRIERLMQPEGLESMVFIPRRVAIQIRQPGCQRLAYRINASVFKNQLGVQPIPLLGPLQNVQQCVCWHR